MNGDCIKKIVFVTHEFGDFLGHGGVAAYLDILVTQILKRFENYKVVILTVEYNKDDLKLENKKLKLYELKGRSLHELGKEVLKHLKMIKPDFVECTDYMSLGLESLCYRNKTTTNELVNTKFITVHHTASRECFEWNDGIPVKFASQFVRECYEREKTQMKLSDLNVAPSNFMRKYVMKNYKLSDVITILHPLSIEHISKPKLLQEMSNKFDLSLYENRFVISCISRVEGRKNQMLLVKQFIKFLEITKSNAILLLVGNSSINSVTKESFRSEIYEIIPEKYIINIHFFDFMSYLDKKKIYAISDLMILASTFECLSLALVEAVAHEVPVITSEYCGFVDYMGDTARTMTFNPFKMDDLLNRMLLFYSMKKEEREHILSIQKESLFVRSDYEQTIDRRLILYNKANIYCKSYICDKNTLVINLDNYFTVINQEILNKNYNSVLVSFYSNENYINKLKEFFYNFSDNFEKESIICNSKESIQKEYITIVEDGLSFYINSICLEKSWEGKSFVDVISFYGNICEIYNLWDENEDLSDEEKRKNSDEEMIRRESFKNKLISDYFYGKNQLNLRGRYAE